MAAYVEVTHTQPLRGADMSDPLNLLEDPGAEENLGSKAWFDGTNNAMTAGWSYSTANPLTGARHLRASSASNNLYLYNRALMAVREGQSFYLAVPRETTSSGGTVGSLQVGVEWLDSGLVLISRSLMSFAVSTAYAEDSFQASAPATATFARFFLRTTSFTSGADFWDVDDALWAWTIPGQQIANDSFISTTDGIVADYFQGNSLQDVVASNITVDADTNTVLNIGANEVEPGLITDQTAEATPDNADVVLIYDNSATALRKMTRANFLSGISGYTDEQAQDAVGSILADDGHVDFTYDDATPKITASLKTSAAPQVARLGLGVAPDASFPLKAGDGTNSLHYDPSTGKLHISAPAATLAVNPGVNFDFNGDADAALSYLIYDHNNLALAFDAWWNGSNWVSSQANSNFAIYKTNNRLSIAFKSSVAKGSTFATFDTTTGIQFTSDGKMGAGTTTPASKVDVAESTGGILTLRRVDTSVTANDMIGKLQFYAADTSTSTNNIVADIEAQATQNVTTDVNPGRLIFRTTDTGVASTPAERMRITEAGNVKIAGTATRATTEGTNHLDIFDGTAPAGTLANGVSLYSTAGELRVMDAAGNATLLSPHSKEDNAWIYQSKDINGKVLTVEIEKLLRFLNDQFNLGLIHEVIE